MSDGEGGFLIALLQPGLWKVEVAAPGFDSALLPEVAVDVDHTAQLRVTLQVAGSHTSVAVLSGTASAAGDIVSRKDIENLPLNGRQYLDLAQLAPGIVPAPAGTQGLGFNFAGSRSQSNVYLLDGVSNQDTQNNGALNGFRLGEAVEEFDVQTSPPLPEFGRGSGAQINVATRSGTNEFHGSLFEYVRNTQLSANDFFTNKLGGARSPLNRNQFGGALGGPVRQDRTFFFASYEGFRQVAHVVTSTRVPSSAERATVTDPVSLRLLDYWPQPNAPGTTNYISDVRSQDSDNTGFIRLDHRIGARDQVFVRWIEYQGASVVPGPTALTGGNTGQPGQRSGALRETHSFSPFLINEFVAGYSSNRQERAVQDGSVSTSSLLNVPGVSGAALGLPSITVSGGYASLGSNQNFPQGRFTDTAEISDNASWHSMRFGANFRRERLRQYLERSSRGTLTFSSFANFAKGLINSATDRSGSTLAHWQRWPMAFYWQDERRVFPNLSLTYGVRYEAAANSVERDGRLVNFVPGVGPVLGGTSQLVLIDPTKTGPAAIKLATAPVSLPASGIQPDRNNFAPMAGLAWSRGDWVVRAGYRLGYDESFGNLLTSMALAPPFSLQTSQTANVTQPGAFGWALAYNQNVPLISNYGKQGPGTPTSGIVTLQGIDPNLRTPYVSHYSLAVQRPVGKLVVLDATYQGSSGHKLGIYVDVNQPTVIVRDPTKRGPVAPNEQIFPYPQWGQVQIVKSIGNSTYNGVVLSARTRPRAPGYFQLSWTLGKSLDYNSSYYGSGSLPGETGAPPDSTNLRLEHGPSSFDVRSRITGLYGITFHGWQLYGMVVAQSGSPFTVVSGNPDSNGFNQATAGVSPNGGNRPDIVHAGALPTNYGNPDNAFDTTWFAPALAGRVGTSGRNQYRGPGLVNCDVAFARRIRPHGRLGAEVRTDFFNVLNHTNFANPVADLSNANFGRITQTLASAVSNAIGTSGGATGGPRVIQVSMRLRF